MQRRWLRQHAKAVVRWRAGFQAQTLAEHLSYFEDMMHPALQRLRTSCHPTPNLKRDLRSYTHAKDAIVNGCCYRELLRDSFTGNWGWAAGQTSCQVPRCITMAHHLTSKLGAKLVVRVAGVAGSAGLSGTLDRRPRLLSSPPCSSCCNRPAPSTVVWTLSQATYTATAAARPSNIGDSIAWHRFRIGTCSAVFVHTDVLSRMFTGSPRASALPMAVRAQHVLIVNIGRKRQMR